MDAALFSSERPDWQTPDVVLERVRKVAPIALDPCTVQSNPVGAARWLTVESALDGLTASWTELADGGLVYHNPPYGRALSRWAAKVDVEACDGAEIITLVPARTDTKWFHTLVENARVVCFWKGRIKFRGATAGAPFPSAAVYHGERGSGRFYGAFRDAGLLWVK